MKSPNSKMKMDVEVGFSTAVVRSGDVLIIGFANPLSMANIDQALGAIKGRLAECGIDVKVLGVDGVASILVARPMPASPETVVSDDAIKDPGPLG